jgi:hypothetical protein
MGLERGFKQDSQQESIPQCSEKSEKVDSIILLRYEDGEAAGATTVFIIRLSKTFENASFRIDISELSDGHLLFPAGHIHMHELSLTLA